MSILRIRSALLAAPCRGGMVKEQHENPRYLIQHIPVAMTQQRSAQVRLLGKLAAKLDADPRAPVEVISQFFIFTDEERQIFLQAYNGDDPITADL